jgi:hypothetical protein
MHTVYLSAAEQRTEWEYALSRLRPREAYLRIRGRTVGFTTASLPRPNPAHQSELRDLRHSYAQQLLMPREQIPEVPGGVSGIGDTASAPPLPTLPNPPASPPIAAPLPFPDEGPQHTPGALARKTALAAATSAVARGVARGQEARATQGL